MGSKSKMKKHLHPVPVQSEGGNGHDEVKEVEQPLSQHEIGAVVLVPDPVFGGLSPTLARINDTQRQLGALTEDYEMRRVQILRSLVEQRQAYSEAVKKTGIDLGLNLGPKSNENWMFDPVRRAFTRQA